MNGASTEMPRYKCHKIVHALKLRDVTRHGDGSATLTPSEDGFLPVVVDEKFVIKHEPLPGGYYVVYEDGYRSFSPGDVFEAGYTLI